MIIINVNKEGFLFNIELTSKILATEAIYTMDKKPEFPPFFCQMLHDIAVSLKGVKALLSAIFSPELFLANRTGFLLLLASF